MQRIFFRILAVIVVAVAIGAAAFSRVDPDFVVRQIADATARATGRPLLFDSAPGISFFPPGVRFGQAHWGEIVNGQGLTLSVKGGMVQLELAPLLTGSVVVRAIRLDSPDLVLRRGKAVGAAHKAPASDAAPSTPAAPAALPLELNRMVLRQGSMLYTDAQGQTLRLSHMNLSVENLRTGQEAVVQCDFTFALHKNGLVDKTAGGQEHAAGTLALSARLRYAPPQLAFRQTSLTLNPLAGALPREAGPLQLTCEGALDINALRLQLVKAWLNTPQARLGLTGEAALAPPAFKGGLEFEASPRKLAALAGRPLKPTPPELKDALHVKSLVEYGQNSLSLSHVQARLDDIALSGKLRLDMPADGPLAVTAEARTGLVNLDNYQPLPEPPDTAPPHSAKAVPGSGAQNKAAPAQNLPKLDVGAAVAGVRQGALLVKDITLALKGEKGRYALEDFRCVLDAGGTLKATGSLELPSKVCGLKARMTDMSLGPLLEALGKGRPVEGVASGDADLSMQCADLAALRHSLSGRGLVEIRQMRLPAMPALGGKGGAMPERFDLARAPFTARNGEVDIKPVTVSAAGFKAAGTARISLPRQYLDARGNIATLGMNIPVVARGPFNAIVLGLDPRFALDAAKNLPGALLNTGKKAGDATQDAARGTGGLLKSGARGADGLVRGLLDR